MLPYNWCISLISSSGEVKVLTLVPLSLTLTDPGRFRSCLPTTFTASKLFFAKKSPFLSVDIASNTDAMKSKSSSVIKLLGPAQRRSNLSVAVSVFVTTNIVCCSRFNGFTVFTAKKTFSVRTYPKINHTKNRCRSPYLFNFWRTTRFHTQCWRGCMNNFISALRMARSHFIAIRVLTLLDAKCYLILSFSFFFRQK